MDFTRALSDGNGTPAPAGLSAFDSVEAAPEFTPLPPGVYKARILRGEYTTTKRGDDAYRLRFEVTEGEHAGRMVIRTWTFSAKALPYTKRDLSVLGLTSAAKLLSPFPEPGREYIVQIVVALQCGDDGHEFNDIKRIELVRVDESPAAEFILPPPAGHNPGEGGTR